MANKFKRGDRVYSKGQVGTVRSQSRLCGDVRVKWDKTDIAGAAMSTEDADDLRLYAEVAQFIDSGLPAEVELRAGVRSVIEKAVLAGIQPNRVDEIIREYIGFAHEPGE